MTTRIFFTDLDGTFLDHESYEPGAALEAARRFVESHGRLVFCSSKTFAEQAQIAITYGLDVAIISENGSAIFDSLESGSPVVLGCTREDVVAATSEIELELGIGITLLGSLSVEEVVALTGLAGVAASLARDREFSDAIVAPLDPSTLDLLVAAYARRGFRAAMGGRFLGIYGSGAGKGNAVRLAVEGILADARQKVVSGAVGDSENDFGMLSSVTYGYLLRARNALPPMNPVSGMTIVDAFGPRGFELAVDSFMARTRE